MLSFFYWEGGHHTPAYWHSWGVSWGKPCGFSFWPMAKFRNKKILVWYSSYFFELLSANIESFSAFCVWFFKP